MINRMNIITHNEGGQKVPTAFRNQGQQGNSAVIANLGNGDAAAHEHTLPAWLGLASRKSPDILIIKGWTQQQLDAGKFPTSPASKKKVTLLFIEYKRCSDFKFDEIARQQVWEYYTPQPPLNRDQTNLFHQLLALGWTVQGLNADGKLGTAAAHDRMLPLLVGHAGFILQSTVLTVFQEALGLSRTASHKLACALNAHQVTSTSKTFSTAARLKRLGSTSPAAAPTEAGSSSARTTAPQTAQRTAGVG